jgi:hypothetical protein
MNDVEEQEEAAIAQASSRARNWSRGRLQANGMNLNRAEALEQERWHYCTINRWFDQFSGLL